MFNLPDDRALWQAMLKPPLARAVVDLLLPAWPELGLPAGIAGLRTALIDEFDLLGSTRDDAVTLAEEGELPPPLNARYAFQSKAGYELLVTTTNLSLSVPGERYENGDTFAEVWRRVLCAYLDVAGPRHFMRLGVRYVNAAPATVDDWVRWFKPEFTGWVRTGIVAFDAESVALSIVQSKHDAKDQAATSATVRYGYLPNGIGPEITSTEATSEPSFLADFDLSSERRGDFEVAAIVDLYRDLNHEIARLFRHSLTANGCQQFGLVRVGETPQA